MSDQPIEARYQDQAALKNIRDVLNSKTDTVPFLLMPVRIETRFMTVEKPRKKDIAVGLEDTLLYMAEAGSTLSSGFRRMPRLLRNQAGEKILKNLTQVKRSLPRLSGISTREKGWLKEQMGLIEKRGVQFTRQSGTRSYRDLNQRIVRRIKDLKNAVESIPVAKDQTFAPANQMIAQMTKVGKRLKTANSKHLPFSNPKNKKDLYRYLLETVAGAARFYVEHQSDFLALNHLEKEQLKRIRRLHRLIKRDVSILPKKIEKKFKDKQWKSFLRQLESMIRTSLLPAMTIFEDDVLPVLAFNQKLPKVSSAQIFVQGIRILNELQRISQKGPIRTYAEIINSRNKVKHQLNSLSAMTNRVVEGTPEQMGRIQKLLTEIDQNFDTYAARIKKIRGRNPSQKFGVQKTATFIQRQCQETTAKLSRRFKAADQFLNREDLRASARFYAGAISDLQNLNRKVNEINRLRRVSRSKKTGLKKDVDAMRAKFEIASRKRLVYPNDEFKRLTRTLTRVTNSVKRLAPSKRPPDLSADTIRRTLERSLSRHNAIITDTNDRRYEEYLERPVFAAATDTVHELWVRIYPDDIAIHTHEEGLTQDELDAGKLYWQGIWLASGDKDLELGAWQSLCQSFGSKRAAWIAKKLDPQQDASFRRKPSRILGYVLQNMTDVRTRLNPVNDQDPILSVVNGLKADGSLQRIRLRLRQSLRLLRPLSEDQAFMLEKSLVLARRIESKLQILENKIGALVGEDRRICENILAYYAQLQQKLAGIKPLTSLEFLARQNVDIQFPQTLQKEAGWTEAPRTRVLPDRFAVITRDGSKFKHIAIGKPLPPNGLQVGLDPAKFDTEGIYYYDANQDLQVDPDIRWLTDFKVAQENGMGMVLTLTTAESVNGFDQVFVLGIKDTDPDDGRRILEGLFDNHHYAPDGMSIIPVATPTNNTKEGAAGYQSVEDDFERSHKIEMEGPLFDPAEQNQDEITDGKRLADALGVAAAVFQNIANSDLRQVSQAFIFNRALWPATFGYFLEEIVDQVFSSATIERTKSFFNQFCSGRGFLPSLRVGTQPYGILPTSAFSRFGDAGEDQYPLAVFLRGLNRIWSDLRETHVAHAYNVDSSDPQQHFMTMLGLHATSVSNSYRYGSNIANRSLPIDEIDFSINFKREQDYFPSRLWDLYGQYFKGSGLEDRFAQAVVSDLQESRIYKIRFFNDHAELIGPRIDRLLQVNEDREEFFSDSDPIKTIGESDQTYIDWLLQESPVTIFARNELARFPSTSLLFMLLRQSLLLAYSEAAFDILEREGFFAPLYRRQIISNGHFSTLSQAEFRFLTRWSYFFLGLDELKNEHRNVADRVFVRYMTEDDRNATMAEYLFPRDDNDLFRGFRYRNRHNQYIAKLNAVRDDIARLNEWPTRELDYLLSEHLDLCTHRIDAWLLGLANYRLCRQRYPDPGNPGHVNRGIYLGAYGWVEDLRPGGERAEAVSIPDGLKTRAKPIYRDEDNQGFIHAPSINQAIASAVLRSGYLSSSRATDDLRNSLAVNLSSGRVRAALNLIDGVGAGLEVGAILGCQFERGLHERYPDVELDKFILPLRRKYTLRLPVTDLPNPDKLNDAGNVVDGLALLNAVLENLTALEAGKSQTLFEILYDNGNFTQCPLWLKQLVKPSGDLNHITGTRRKELIGLIKEIDRMADAFDALGDLAVSETVFQTVQGNHARAAAMVNALAEGKRIPRPHIIDTPRTGIRVTQRVLLHLRPIDGQTLSDQSGLSDAELEQNRKAAAPVGWKKIELTPRALAEPSLNAWIGKMVGPTSKIKLAVEYEENEALKMKFFDLAELQIQPLDLLWLAGDGFEEGTNELVQLITHQARKLYNWDKYIKVRPRVHHRKPEWNSDIKTLYEIEPLLRHIKAAVADANPVTASEIRLPGSRLTAVEDLNPGKQNLSEVQTRVEDADARLTDLKNQMQGLIDGFDLEHLDQHTFSQAQFTQLRQLLEASGRFGIAHATPLSAVDSDNESGIELVMQVKAVLKLISRRCDEVSQNWVKFNQQTAVSQKVNTLCEISRTLFGNTFVLLPHYEFFNKAEVLAQLKLPVDQALLRHAGPFAMEDWLVGIAGIRPKMHALEMTRLLAEANGRAVMDLAPVQFPYSSDGQPDYWLGAEYPADYEPVDDKLSLVLLDSTLVSQSGASRVGLIVDEWVETIPRRQEDTGISYYYDAPDATAPQCLLLAVPPVMTGEWTWDDLVYTLIDTLELAKNRAVEPEHIEQSPLAQVLPGIMGEVLPLENREGLEDHRRVVLDFLDNQPQEEA